MTSLLAHQIVLAARPTSAADVSHFRLETATLPTATDDAVLLQVCHLSLDPYVRGRMMARKSYAPAVEVGEKIPGEAIARVVSSKDARFREGDLVLAHTGWCDYAVMSVDKLKLIVPDELPLTTRLGVLGMPGFTAWSGLTLIGKPKAGETVVVSAASGPVGSLVGQLAKMAGTRVVGLAGGARKCAYLVDELNFDAAVDHRAPDSAAQLAAACPDGIDMYFENAGGRVWQMVLPLLNRFARIPVCGLIAYFTDGIDASNNSLALTMREVLSRSLTLRGFINYEFEAAHFDAFHTAVSAGIRAGKIRYREDIVEGLDAAPQAFLGMLNGNNFGKVLVQMS